MRFFALASLVGLAAAAPATVFQQGDAPACSVDSSGATVVHYTDGMHPSFKCTHTSATTCSCESNHPTHHKGLCQQFSHFASGKTLNSGGDCSDSGAYKGTCANGSLLGGDSVNVHAGRTQDNHCGSCNNGYYLNGKSCSAYGGSCSNGSLITQASRDQENHCGSCNNGYWLNNKSCQQWETCTLDHPEEYETQTPTGTRDRLCGSHTVCTASQFTSRAATTTAIRLCAGRGSCNNGSLIAADDADQVNHCGSCNNGYYLNGKSCSAYGGSCSNGSLITQASRTASNHCGSCNNGYYLSGTSCYKCPYGKACYGGTGQPSVQFTAPQNEFKYVRGGKSASNDDATSSVSCGSGWTLTACRCHRNAGCDGAYTSGGTCYARNGVHRSGVYAEAECVRNTMASSSTSTAALSTSDQSTGYGSNPSVSCPSGYTLTGCSCYSPWRGCSTQSDGAQGTFSGNTCHVQGSNVSARARCVKDIKVIAVSSAGWSGSGDDNSADVYCPSGFKIRGCQCADASVCDGAKTAGPSRCVVWNGNGGSGARARAWCVKDDNNSLGVSQSTSGWHVGSASASCPAGSVVTGCTCYSAWVGCSNSHSGVGTDGSISGQTCTVTGGQVSATATCMTGTL